MKKIILILLCPLMAVAGPCQENLTRTKMTCEHKHIKVQGALAKRDLYYAIPEKPAPKKGYPVVLMFHGSFFSVEFSRRKLDPFGGYNEILLIKELLEAGYMVVAPKAAVGLFWQTNLIGLNYEVSSDRYFIDQVLLKLKNNELAKSDMNNLFAVGISSGGYMTDRMAVSHKHTPFKALAIASASHATCGGINCRMPNDIDPYHPPTLFMHGKRDVVVPVYTMKKYEKLLRNNGVKTKKVIDNKATHQWLKSSPENVLRWFEKFRN